MNNSRYTSKHLQELFSVSHETVKNWTREFADFLSAGATPPAGATRVFDDADLTVFALVSEFKRRGLNHTDAHLALQTGQRGDIPNPTALDKLPPSIQDAITRMRDEIDELRQHVKTLESERDETRGQNKLLERLLKEQATDKERQIRELIEENARLKAKGES